MSLRPGTQAAERRKSYKPGVDVGAGRRRREENLVEIRKAQREDTLVKKRRPEHVQESSHHAPNESPAVALVRVDTKGEKNLLQKRVASKVFNNSKQVYLRYLEGHCHLKLIGSPSGETGLQVFLESNNGYTLLS